MTENKQPLIPGKIVNGALCVSNSLLKDVATCQTRAYMTWVLRKTLEGEVGPMLLGSAIHLALANHLKGGTIKSSMVLFRKAYKQWALDNIDPNDKYRGRLSWDNTRKVLRYWLKAHPLDTLPFTVNPALVEVPFAAPLDKKGTIVLRGILDALVRRRESNKLAVLDHKSTGSVNPWWTAQFKLESQITGYIFGVGEQTDEDIEGGYINAVQVGQLPGSSNLTYKCRTHGTTYEDCQALHIGGELLYVPRTPQQTKMWRESALWLANSFAAIMDTPKDKVRELGVEGMFNGSCRTCAFLDWCRNGREPGLIDTMLVDRPDEQVAYYE